MDRVLLDKCLDVMNLKGLPSHKITHERINKEEEKNKWIGGMLPEQTMGTIYRTGNVE